ncbi:MAG: hypothetical protein H6Q89_408 [Myxococcaceae bacterium]|nr:hypothetical protein [Myxococcaceae bacterium]
MVGVAEASPTLFRLAALSTKYALVASTVIPFKPVGSLAIVVTAPPVRPTRRTKPPAS